MNEDEYLTIDSPQQAEIKIKGSSFIGIAQPITSEIHAKNFITQLSNKYFDASHHCYAYIIGLGISQLTRFSDAGEPSGTAGQPILNVLLGQKLSNVIVVVVRYFGGTKLGKGGLVRAYVNCAFEVIKKCTIVKKYHYQTITIEFEYDLTGAIRRVIDLNKAKIISSTYDQKTKLVVSLRKSFAKEFERKLVEATSGKIAITKDGLP